MAEGPETPEQRLKRERSEARTRWAERINSGATLLVISAAFTGIASIFIGRDSLVAWAMLFVVFAYFAFLVAAFVFPHDYDHRFRHVVYQSAAFIVLALSLRAFGLHEAVGVIHKSLIGTVTHAGAAEAPMDARSVGELAAVMILFILVEIAAFVAQDVDEARAQVKKVGGEVVNIEKTVIKIALEMKSSAEGLADSIYQIALANLDPSVMTEAIALTRLWSLRVPNLGEKPAEISQRCWRILLQTYLREECDDFWPSRRHKDRRLEGIPRCVRPVGPDVSEKDVSYFATNVGFYVKFLADLVRELQTTKTKDQKVCIAVVTNVLPAHWWNWTFSAKEWRAYTAIEDLRKEMRNIADGGAHVDRVIAVAPDESADPHGPNQLGLWPESLLYDMLANWQILADRSKPNPKETADCSIVFEKARDEIGSIAFASFPEALKNGAKSKLDTARIYPMITHPSSRTYHTNNHTWTPAPLRDAYQELQGKGRYWRLRVNSEVEDDLDKHFDVMFIGLGPEDTGRGNAGVWSTDNVEWGVGLMNSYDAASETMFLSVISNTSVDTQYEWWRKRLGDAVDWENGVLPDAADTWKATAKS